MALGTKTPDTQRRKVPPWLKKNLSLSHPEGFSGKIFSKPPKVILGKFPGNFLIPLGPGNPNNPFKPVNPQGKMAFQGPNPLPMEGTNQSLEPNPGNSQKF